MKQKTIIQVWGTQGSGKSGTIKIIKEELVKRYLNPSHTYTLPLPKGEINDVFDCNGYKVGIESMGDYLWAWNLHDRLNAYVLTHKCDLIICASRVYNDVSNHIKDLADQNGYRILKMTNYRGNENDFNQGDLNQLSAIHAIDLVDKIFNKIV